MKKVLLSLTTLGNPGNMEKQIDDLAELGIKEFALFSSMLKELERKDIFRLIESKIPGATIPFCHAKSDMRPEEFEYMIKKFETQKFNLHTEREHPVEHDISAYKDRIYIENTGGELLENDISSYAGICLDTAHLTFAKLTNKKNYENTLKLLDKYKIGANHISAIGEKYWNELAQDYRYDYHYLSDLNQLEYLKEIPKKYFSDLIAIELGNDIATQLKVKERIEDIIGL